MVDRPRKGRFDLFPLTKFINMLKKNNQLMIMILYHLHVFNGKSNKQLIVFMIYSFYFIIESQLWSVLFFSIMFCFASLSKAVS